MAETQLEFVERMATEHWWHWCKEDFDQLLALARRGAAVQWRPIEEAPEGVMRLILYTPPYGAGSGHAIGDGWNSHFCVNKEAQPTHFMPLPPPPEAKP